MRGVNGGPSASRSMLGCARDLLYEADQVSFTVPNRRTDADRRAKIHALPHESHVSDLELSGEFRDVSRLEHKCFIPDWEEVIRRVREERVDAVPTRGLEQLDIYAGASPAYIKTRMRAHIEDILTYPGIGDEMIDWDVLNEITTNNDYANHFAGTPGYTTGRELYPEIFKQADSLAIGPKWYLNDYVAIEQGDSPSNGIATWRSRIDELLAAGAPLDGLGFQGHFSASPTGIPRVKEIYDEFWNAYGLEAKVTEYDIDKLVPAQTQAAYMRDILTITFAHPSMKGFLMWGFFTSMSISTSGILI